MESSATSAFSVMFRARAGDSSEAWSTPGTQAQILEVPPCGDVGILICADAYSPGIAEQLRLQGARLLVSAAAWAPGLHGPNGEWERISQDTGLPTKWSAHAKTDSPYTIDSKFAQRIDWAVDQATVNQLNIILNVQHYEGLDGNPDQHANHRSHARPPMRSGVPFPAGYSASGRCVPARAGCKLTESG